MSNNELNQLIQKQIDDYVEKYSSKHNISKEEARKHIMVKISEEMYKKGQLE